MKITANPQSTGTNGAAAEGAPVKPGSRFSKVLKGERQQEGKHELPVTADAVTAAPPLMPGFLQHDVAPVDVGHAVTVTPDVLLASLVQEVAAEAPPGGVSSVEIQFDSRTLEGLHVRLEKTGDKIGVRFSTASEAVTRLLTANVDRLTEALVQRGYVAPSVSVQRVGATAGTSPGDFRDSRRQGGGRGGQNPCGGQKRG
jgi:flagellar hook-length control protein FliK